MKAATIKKIVSAGDGLPWNLMNNVLYTGGIMLVLPEDLVRGSGHVRFVDSDDFLEALKKDVTFRLARNRVYAVCNGIEREIPTLPDVELDAPKLPKFDGSPAVFNLSKNDADYLNTAASRDVTRYNLQYVCFKRKFKGGHVRATTSDGHRLHQVRDVGTIPQEFGSDTVLVPSWLLPVAREGAEIRVFACTEKGHVLCIAEGADYMLFVEDNQENLNYPDYEQVLPRTSTVTNYFVADPKAFRTLQKMMLGRYERGVKCTVNGSVDLVAAEGAVKASLPCTDKAGDWRVGIDIEYLCDAVGPHSEVRIATVPEPTVEGQPDVGVLGPVVVTGSSPRYFAIVMPMRY